MKNKCKQKNTNAGFVLAMLICVAIGICAGLMMPKYFDAVPENHGTPIALAILVVYVVIAFYGAIILHESGHLVFGILTGYRFSSFRIGSVMLIRIKGKLKLKLHSIKGTGGQCLLSPPDMLNGRIPYVLYMLGGVIFNTVSALGFGLLAYLLRAYVYASAFFFVLAVLNLALGASNGIPISTATLDNDGKNAISLGQNPKALRALWIQLKINSETADGKRLRDMPDEWFLLPDEENVENPLIASLITFRENRLMDMRCFEEAESLIKKYKSSANMPGIYKTLMTLDEITLSAMRGADYSEIGSLFTKDVHTIMNSMKGFPQVIRTKYVFALLVENNPSGAKGALDSFEKIKKTYPYTADLVAEEEIMKIAQSKTKDVSDTESL